MVDAVGYPLSPRQVGADFINELMTQDTSVSSFPAMVICCRRLRYVSRVPPTRTPLKCSRQPAVSKRQPAVARSKKATHSP
jgi:hypothetical protein